MKKITIFFSLLFLFSCGATVEDARKVKLGISTEELKYVMGEPFSIEVNNGYENLYFSYSTSGHKEGMKVTIVNNKVTDFSSY